MKHCASLPTEIGHRQAKALILEENGMIALRDQAAICPHPGLSRACGMFATHGGHVRGAGRYFLRMCNDSD